MPSFLAAAMNPGGPMADWPDWLVVVAAIFAMMVVGWLLVKLLKFALWLACVAVLVGGAVFLFQRFMN